jgi:tetrahydromethanopterin S-methyltransferase subunit C
MSTSQGTARSIVRRLIAERTTALIGATAVLVVLGLIAVLTDEYDLALVCVLVLQAAIAGFLVTAPEAAAAPAGNAQDAVDRASARTLADLAHTRQSILDAIAELDSRTK